MAYTDTTIGKSTTIKSAHVSELVSEVDTIITNAKLTSSISVGTMNYDKVNSKNITNLQKAINALEGSFSNNCCESNKCQTCQSDKCQTCQGCQNSCTCQSSKCQSCQTCQKNCSCQSCQNICSSNCSNGCSSCFIAGTLILMADSTWKPIETITAGEYVQGINGINPVLGTQRAVLGPSRCIWTFRDKSIYFSGEHLFWVKKKDKEFFGVADMTQHLLEKDVELCPQFEGLTLKQDVICIDRPVEYAVIDGWKTDRPIIAREYGNDTQLYELVLGGTHTMIANGYVVGGNVHDDDVDYSTIHWDGVTGNE